MNACDRPSPRDLARYALGCWETALGALRLRARLVRPEPGSVAFFAFRRDWNVAARRAFGFEIVADGPRPEPARERGTLLIANHASFADLTVLICETPAEARLNFVAKKEAGDVPIFGWHMRRFGDLLFDRADPEERAALVDRALSRLAAGFSLGLFPEGTRSKAGAPRRDAHLTLIDAAVHAGFAVQPVAMVGTRGVMEDWRLRHPGHTIRARFGAPRRDYANGREAWNDVLRMWSEIAPATRGSR